jgi:hypothetical protein
MVRHVWGLPVVYTEGLPSGAWLLLSQTEASALSHGVLESPTRKFDVCEPLGDADAG